MLGSVAALVCEASVSDTQAGFLKGLHGFLHHSFGGSGRCLAASYSHCSFSFL